MRYHCVFLLREQGSAVTVGGTLEMMSRRPQLCCRATIGVLDLGSIFHMQLVLFLSPCGEDCTRSHRGLLASNKCCEKIGL